jgi:c-di-GMP-binding flagellar brake protein YcgR
MRRFVRVNKVLRVQYTVLPAQGREGELVHKTAELLNISAGGMSLAVPEFIGQGKQLVLQFILSMDDKYSSFKEVSRVTRTVPSEEIDMFHIGVEFSNIQKKNASLISSYVMKTLWTQALL